MVYSVMSCALVGLEAHLVVCEVGLAAQLPTVSLIGLPSSVTQESRERIRAAIVNSGFDWPARRVTISLLPASLPKWGSHFELAMALGVLGAAPNAVDLALPQNVLALGELSLDGRLRPCRWAAAIASWLLRVAREMPAGTPLLVVAHEEDVRSLHRAEPALASFCELAGAVNLNEAYDHLLAAAARAKLPAEAARARAIPVALTSESNPLATLASVRDEPLGVVAALAAIAGGHHCLFAGPHGMGKSLLIRAVCEGSSPLDSNEGALRESMLRTFGDHFAEWNRDLPKPVVHLQSSASRAALEGALLASGQVLPGEMTRAHFGVLVADELLEFRRDAIEALRQPLDEGVVRLQRARFRTLLPARFQFLASTNLCPCGFFGHERRRCRCSKPRREGYQLKLSGPLLDRFDLVILVGERQGGGQAQLPPDLVSMLGALSDPASWRDRLSRVSAATEAEDKVQQWADVSCAATDRGRLKISRVAATLAALLFEPRQPRHLRLAALLRRDLNRDFQDALAQADENTKKNHKLA